MRTSTRRSRGWFRGGRGAAPGERARSGALLIVDPQAPGEFEGWSPGSARRTGVRAAILLAGGMAATAAAAPWTAADRAPESVPTAEARPVAAAPAPLGRPALGEDLVELGRRLFFDPGASHSKRVACASCHDPEHGYSDPAVVSNDDFGQTTRHSQPLLGLRLESPLHWDGEFASIEDLVAARTGAVRSRFGGYRGDGQAQETLLKVTPVAETLASAGLYGSAFEAAFGDPKPTPERLSMALGWYVRSLEPTPSPYDRYAAGDASALSPEAVRGLELFRGRAGCAQCHAADGERPAFTDHAFHNTGVAKSPAARARRGRGPVPGLDEGHGRFSKRAEHARAFKTPSLRDVALRAPYMHDGSFATLEAVVRYYALDCGSSGDDRMDARLAPFAAGRPAAETDQDVRDLVAFLVSLTGETRAGLATTEWSRRPEKMRLRFVNQDGTPYRGAVALAPAGDPIPAGGPSRAPSASAPFHVTTDAEGWVETPPPSTTHLSVRVLGANLRPVGGDFVPDTCREGVLTLEPGTPHLAGHGGGGAVRVRRR
jgi:cytochrome c peroxidase